MTALKALSVTRAHHGALHRFQLESETLKCATVFSVFVPDASSPSETSAMSFDLAYRAMPMRTSAWSHSCRLR